MKGYLPGDKDQDSSWFYLSSSSRLGWINLIKVLILVVLVLSLSVLQLRSKRPAPSSSSSFHIFQYILHGRINPRKTSYLPLALVSYEILKDHICIIYVEPSVIWSPEIPAQALLATLLTSQMWGDLSQGQKWRTHKAWGQLFLLQSSFYFFVPCAS